MFYSAPMRSGYALALFCAASLVGCGLFPSDAERAMQKSPSYRAGYDDGCAAASTVGANPREQPYRDDMLYESDTAYRAGWGSGFSTCRDQTRGGAPLKNSLSPVPGQR